MGHQAGCNKTHEGTLIYACEQSENRERSGNKNKSYSAAIGP